MKKVVLALFVFGLVISLYACASTTGRSAGAMVDDSKIADQIRAKIVEDPQLSIMKINTDVFNGNVTLLGVVPNRQAEDRLISLARGVSGVKSVTSKLTIQRP